MAEDAGAPEPGPTPRRLGLIVNPIAGMGGRVGLKGTDGPDALRRAIALGAVPVAPARARKALERLRPWRDRLEMWAPSGAMGEVVARESGFAVTVVPSGPAPTALGAAGHPPPIPGPASTSDDTVAAARALAAGVDLLLFAGGDGTAGDIIRAVGTRLPTLGVPAGVKMHSAVFGRSPGAAGDLAAHFLFGERAAVALREAEVMDTDEEAFREGRLSARLVGSLLVPYERGLVQGAKDAGGLREETALEAIASDVINQMAPGALHLVGPGSTTGAVLRLLGLEGTLLGVDALRDRRLVGIDLNERGLLDLLAGGGPAWLVVTPIGGQGFLFGRGNQQLSPAVLRAVGRERIMVIAARSKLVSLEGAPLLADTGDDRLDQELSGYVRVVTGLRESTPYPLRPADAHASADTPAT